MKARTDANTSAGISLVIGILVFGVLIPVMAIGPILNSLQTTAAGNPQTETAVVQTIGIIQSATMGILYATPIIIILIVIVALWRYRRQDTPEPAQHPADAPRYAPRMEPGPVQAVVAREETQGRAKSEEKKPEKRDRYRAVKV